MTMNLKDNPSTNEKIKKRKINFFFIVFGAILTVVAFAIILKFLLYNGSINQGKFRVVDAILSSTVDMEDTGKETGKWSFDISQKNILTLLVKAPKGTKIAQASLTNAYSTGGKNIVLSQDGEESTITTNNYLKLPLKVLMYDENTIIFKINIENKKAVSNAVVPSGVEEIKYDGSILKVCNIPYDDIKCNVKFQLNITGSMGKTSSLKIDLELPNKKVLDEGNFVTRLDVTTLPFRTNKILW